MPGDEEVIVLANQTPFYGESGGQAGDTGTITGPDGARFEVIRSDETLSTERLRSGEAVAALTATREPVPGCTSMRIGIDRYRAVAAPEKAVSSP